MERKQLLTELPKLWAIQRTPDNYRIVNEWINKIDPSQLTTYTACDGYIHSQSIQSENWLTHYSREKDMNSTEISDIEFRVLVLGEKLKVSDLKGKVAINVTTHEEYTQILEILRKENSTYTNEGWNPDTWLRSCWDTYGSKTCITAGNENGWSYINYYESIGYTIYPASWFITTNNTTMNKEIIGYTLKPECEKYKKAAEDIVFPGSDCGWAVNVEYLFTADSRYKEKLEAAGVLNLWFNPVYAPEKPKYQVGDWVTVTEEDTNADYPVGKTFQVEYMDKGSKPPKTTNETNVGDLTTIAGEDPLSRIWATKVRPATEEEIKNASAKVLTLGDKNTRITIRKGSIEAEGNTVSIDDIRRVQKDMKPLRDNVVGPWIVLYPSVKIGCCTFTKEEIDTIISTYDNLNK